METIFIPVIKAVIALCLLMPWIIAGLAGIALILLIGKIILEFIF
jgi:hypothetical protein